MTKVFLSYNFTDEVFVERVARYLATQEESLVTYFYKQNRRAGAWAQQIAEAVNETEACVAVAGTTLGVTQTAELAQANLNLNLSRIWVRLPGGVHPNANAFGQGLTAVEVNDLTETGALECAREIAQQLGHEWVEIDDVPPHYPFGYEKRIVEVYHATCRQRGQEVQQPEDADVDPPTDAERACVPVEWPKVHKWSGEEEYDNPVPAAEIGTFRPETARVIVDARVSHAKAATDALPLSLLEAGPRGKLLLPNKRGVARRDLRVAIIVSGGIAPGINAVISGIYHRHQLYARRTVYNVMVGGYPEGFSALIVSAGPVHPLQELQATTVDTHGRQGGSLISTSRHRRLLAAPPNERAQLLEDVVSKLQNDQVDILYIIGGDGSMRAAHAISTIARRAHEKAPKRNRRITVVGIPKTMDNDILWVWQSFGFLSAVERAREVILHLQTEVRSNPRLCIVQLFGSDSGFVVAHAVLGTGQCDYALVPEVEFKMQDVCEHMRQVLETRRTQGSPHGMIVMSETAIPSDVSGYMATVDLSKDERDALKEFAALPGGRRVRGQTPDALRSAGLRVVAGALTNYIQNTMGAADPYWKTFRIVTNEPRHVLRSAEPSVSDVIFGQRLGALAVDNALAGYTDFMISQWNTEYVLVPLKLVVLGRKRLPEKGIFWKSVLANTRQSDDAQRPSSPHDSRPA